MTRLGTVDEIAQTVLFLAGEGGSYITAQTIHVNGGMYTPQDQYLIINYRSCYICYILYWGCNIFNS